MRVQSLRTTLPQAAGILNQFRGEIRSQAHRQIENVRVEVKRLINYRA